MRIRRVNVLSAVVLSTAMLVCDIPMMGSEWGLSAETVQAADGEENIIESGVTTGRNVIGDGYRLYYNASGKIIGCITYRPDVSIKIPANVSEAKIPVTEIADNAFNGQKNIVYVQASVLKKIGKNAFKECSKLQKVIYNGAQMKSIGDYCFYKCTSLVSISGTCTGAYVGDYAFYRCGKLVKFPVDPAYKKCDYLGKYAFANSGVEDVQISVNQAVGDYCFKGCKKLKTVNIASEKIGAGAFYDCTELGVLVLSNNLTSIGANAFKNCMKLATVKSGNCQARNYFTQNLTVGKEAFCNTAMDYVIFAGNGILEKDAFLGTNLSFATLVGDVTVGECALGYALDRTPIDGFVIKSNRTKNMMARAYADDNHFPFKRTGSNAINLQPTFKELEDRYYPYLMGTRKFSAEIGSCFGIATVQILSMTKLLDIFDDFHKVPTSYQGQPIRCLHDLPKHASYEERIKSFDPLTKIVDYYQQAQGRGTGYTTVPLEEFNFEELAQATRLGADCTCMFEVPSHSHVVSLFGIQKKSDVYDLAYWKEIEAYMGKEYDYRLLMYDSKYCYKKDEEGNVWIEGSDADTFDKKTEVRTWKPVETGYLYINSKTGDAFQSVYDSEANIKDQKEENPSKPWKEMNFSTISIQTVETLSKTPDPADLVYVGEVVTEKPGQNKSRPEGTICTKWLMPGKAEYTTNARKFYFSDIKDTDTAAEAAKFVYSNNYMDCVMVNSFAPKEIVSRELVVETLFRVSKDRIPGFTNIFSDVTAASPRSIIWAAKHNIVNGYRDGTFQPELGVTRAHFAMILRNFAKYQGKDVSATTDLSIFVDAKQVNASARTAVEWAVANRIINGKKNGTMLDPYGSVTRAELAMMIQSYCKKFMNM